MSVEIQTQSIRVPFRGRDVEVHEARPLTGIEVPVVLVIQEWWGLNRHIRDVAERLAREGFRALAPDLYDGRVTADAGEAADLMSALDPGETVARLSVVLDATVGKQRAGVMGFCMGGSYTLLLAANDPRIGAAVPFYGQVPGDDVLKGIRVPVLFFAAGRDHWITKEETERLGVYLEGARLAGGVVRYTHADHAFFNDTRAEVYRKDLADEAWTRTVRFLKEHLQ